MSKPSRIFAAGSNWLAFAATLAVAFFLTPHLIRNLGPARYDVWCVVEAILVSFTLLDLGVGACLVRSTARCYANGDREGLNRVASCSLAVFSAAGLAALIIGIPLALLLGPSLGVRTGDTGDTTAFMLVMLVSLACSLPLCVFPSLLDGLERYPAKSLVRIVALAVKTAGYLAVTWDRNALLPLAIVSFAVMLAENAALAVLCRRYLPGLRLSRRFLDRLTFRDIRGYSGDAFLTMLAGRIATQTGAILIGLFLPAGQLTAYATAARLVEYAKTLLRTVTTTLTPGIAAMQAMGDENGIRRLFLTGTRVVLYLVLPVNVGLIFFGEPFLQRWVGPEVANGGYPALVVLSMVLTLGVAQSMAGRVMYGLGQLKWYARLALLEAAINAILTVAFIRPFGVVGVAIAVVVPNAIFCFVTIGMACRAANVEGRAYRNVWIKPCLAVSIPMAVWFGIGPVEAMWPGVFGGIAAGLVPYGLGVLVMEGSGRIPFPFRTTHSAITETRSRFGRRSGRPAVASHS